VEIPIDGELIPIYWAKTGHADRAYHNAYVKSKILDAYKSGIIQRYPEKEILNIKNPQRFIVPKHSSVVPESIAITSDNEVVMPDTYKYHADVAVIDFVDKGIMGNLELEYKYYDEESYNDFVDTYSTCMMIFLSTRNRKDHNVRIFENIRKVEELKLEERNDIISKYYKDIGVTEEDLKSLSQSDFFVEGDNSQKNMDSTLSAKKSGENMEETEKI